MPKIDYTKTIIYKIVCNDLSVTDIYVGHTTNFTNRKRNHKDSCNNSNSNKYNRNVYKIIRENGGFDNWDMIMIEVYSCNNRRMAEVRERYWIESLNARLNTYIPTLTIKEYKGDKDEINKEKQKVWYEENKEKCLERSKKQREEHPDEIKEYKKKWYEENKDEHNKKGKEWYKTNKENVLNRQKELYEEKKKPYTCCCGSILTIHHKNRHEKSQKHQLYIAKINTKNAIE